MDLKIAVLPGDGIGPEVTAEAVKVLRFIADEFDHKLELNEFPIGGTALDQFGEPLPESTLKACLSSRAVLLGAVGGPKYDKAPRGSKPEDALLALRRALGGFANLRPVKVFDELLEASPLKAETVRGCDLVIVRELLGGLYYGTPRGQEGAGSPWRAFNTMTYTVSEIERIARVAFDLAHKRRRKLTSVDKANVLETSELWRSVVNRVSHDYPQVELEHMLVDTCAMQLVQNPRRFDVVLTENMFGDILSDEASVLAGSIGMLSSASIGGKVGLYEPVHGSAPDIAGSGKANPLGAIQSAALALRYSFGLETEARRLESAVSRVLARGIRSADLTAAAYSKTTEIGTAVREAIADQRQSMRA
ncbi:MAG TPA: 3-isopropylmalate dehydrogenase [Blastocatellia bacterium]|nr:3-isopropylmalate dehydrogenase [Blastocatellia bacterium]